MVGNGQIKSVDEAYAEISEYVRKNVSDPWSLSPEVYHTITKNMDFYNFKSMNYGDSHRAFNSAYRATLNQLRAGIALVKPPSRDSLIEQKSHDPMTPEQIEAAERSGKKAISALKGMFDD